MQFSETAFLAGRGRYLRVDEDKGGAAAAGPLGAGSYGRVILAIDRVTDEVVACKRQKLPSESCMRELTAHMFLRSNPHPNVLMMRDHFVFSVADGAASASSAAASAAPAPRRDYLYMVFDVCPSTLWAVWNSPRGKGGCLDEAVRFGHVAGVAAGLQHLHSLAVVHGDLSLANVLVSSDGSPLIADVGTAVAADSYLRKYVGEVTTPYVRSPELLLGNVVSTREGDCWALGLVALALGTGQLPTLTESVGVGVDLGENDVAAASTGVFWSIVRLIGPFPHEEFVTDMCFAKWPKFRPLYDAALAAGSILGGSWEDALTTRICLWPEVRHIRDSDPAVVVAIGCLRWAPQSRLTAQDAHSSCQIWKHRGQKRALSLALDPVAGADSLPAENIASSELSDALPSGKVTPLAAHADAKPSKESVRAVPSEDVRPLMVSTRSTPPTVILQSSSETALLTGGGCQPQLQVCRCSGNCGEQSCNAFRKKRSASRCVRPVAEGSRACIRCECAHPLCHNFCRGANYCWCDRHKPETRAGVGYWRLSGAFEPFQRSWGAQVRVLAASSPILPRLAMPCASHIAEMVRGLADVRAGVTLSPLVVVAAFVAHTISVTPLVRFFVDKVLAAEELTAQTIARVYVSTVLKADGERWPRAWGRMIFGRSRTTTGMLTTAKDLGVITEHKVDNSVLVHLGKDQATYYASYSQLKVEAEIERAVVVASSSDWSWPQTTDLVGEFGDKLVKFARAVRNTKKSEVGFKGGGGNYVVKSFAANLMCVLDGAVSMRALSDDIVMKRILDWTPDEKNYCAPLVHLTGGELRGYFGCSPYAVSFWLCDNSNAKDDILAEGMTYEMLGLLFEAVHAYEAEVDSAADADPPEPPRCHSVLS